MTRLALDLIFRGGRETLSRLLATVVAVAIGAAILLSLAAEYHGFQATSRTPSWSQTQAAARPNTSHDLLWNYSESTYEGHPIDQLVVASQGPAAPHIAGVAHLPTPGTYLASPAMTRLLRTVPADQLGTRYSGRQIGTLGEAALANPATLAIVIGSTPTAIAKLPGTLSVDTVSTAPRLNGTTGIYRLAFGVGAIAVLFPLLILITTAARLSAARREQRLAAMRLVGATSGQVAYFAAIEAAASALAGTVVGFGLFFALRPLLVSMSFSGERFFPNTVMPHAIDGLTILVAVPLAATVAVLISLRRLRTSPFGVARRQSGHRPRLRSAVPLVLGLALFFAVVLPAHASTEHGPNVDLAPTFNVPLLLLAMLLILAGLISGGPWLTAQSARLLNRGHTGAAGLLASRRLSDSPATAFRAISGLVLAVFVATLVAVVGATVNEVQTRTIVDKQLSSVLRVEANLTPTQSAQLLHQLGTYPGVQTVPFYAMPGAEDVVSCQSLALLPVLGSCPAGTSEIQTATPVLTTDNPLELNKALPLISSTDPSADLSLGKLQLDLLLIKTPSVRTLEQVRTFLTTNPDTYTGQTPQTFGDSARLRAQDITNVQRVVLAVIVLTLLVAGSSLAVTVGGGLLERRRPFTLLRLAGASASTLRRTVLLETTAPLIGGAVVALGLGLAVAIPLAHVLLPAGTPIAAPAGWYYGTVGGGIALSVLITAATLPLLGRLTNPNDARFE